MKISQDELLELLDDICSEVSRVVASHAEICRELAEDSLDRTRTDAQQTRIDRLKMELEREKAALNTLRRRQQHKRQMLKRRNDSKRQRSATAGGGGTSKPTNRF
jgi:predicted RNase H-like nuclease (RuvC/YqgF family)